MGAAFCGAVCPAGPLFGWARLACTGPVRPCLRRGRGVPGSAPTRLPCAPAGHGIGLKRRPGCRLPGSAPIYRPRPCRSRWPQSPAGLGCGCAATGGAGLRPCPVTDWPQTPARLGLGGGWGRAGVPPHKLQGAGSVASRRPCVQFAAGAPRPVPTPRSRTRPTAGGWDEAVTDNGPLHSADRHCCRSSQRSMGDGLVLLPPAGRRRRDGRAGSCRGAPAANCRARPP